MITKQQAQMKIRGFLPVKVAAAAVGVHVSTIYRLMDGQTVVGERLGKTRYVNKRSLADYYGNEITDKALGVLRPKKKA